MITNSNLKPTAYIFYTQGWSIYYFIALKEEKKNDLCLVEYMSSFLGNDKFF